MKRAIALLLLVLAAPATASDKPALDLADFFSGRTHGEGTLKKALHRPVRITVDTIGKRGSGGEMILIDTIHEEGEPERIRRWVMRPAKNGFTGTISDAVGPVTVDVEGTKATIRYKMKGGVNIHQTLSLRDSRTLSSHLSARKLGLRVATMEATIRKVE